MTDRVFFLLSALAAAALVLIALQPFSERPPSGPLSGGGRNAEDLLLEGPELHRFLAGGMGSVSVAADETGKETLRINRLPADAYSETRLGPHVVLAEDVEFALESRKIEIVIEARARGEFAARSFEANYLARPGKESGWTAFEVTSEFAPYTLSYSNPSRGDGEGYDYIGVRPVATDRRAALEIRSIRIRAAGPKEKPGGSGD